MHANASDAGPGKSLANKITEAERALAASDLAKVQTVLGALIIELAAQTGKKVTPELAATLTAEANQVISQLGL
jgi:hypothetical protein